MLYKYIDIFFTPIAVCIIEIFLLHFDWENVSNVHVCLFYLEQCPCELYYTKSLFRNWVRDVCKHADVSGMFFI